MGDGHRAARARPRPRRQASAAPARAHRGGARRLLRRDPDHQSRARPPHGDLDAGIELMKSVRVYPLDGPGDGSDVEWGELSLSLDYSPGPFETEMVYWEMLHDLIDTEPPYDAYRNEYGNLAALGIAK